MVTESAWSTRLSSVLRTEPSIEFSVRTSASSAPPRPIDSTASGISSQSTGMASSEAKPLWRRASSLNVPAGPR